MRIFTLVLASIVLAGGCAKRQSQTTKETNSPSVQPVANDSLDDALAKLNKIPTESCHRFLKSASLLIPPACVGQNLSDVKRLLENNNISSIESWENGSAINNYYQLQKNAIQLTEKHSVDLWLLLTATPAQKIYAGDVAVVSNFAESYSDVVKNAPYPNDSVLYRVLHCEEVKKTGASWPYLKRIMVHYGPIQNRWVEHYPSGFHVTVEFCASLTEEIAGKKMYFSVPSGLDPLTSYTGEIMPNSKFKESDTLGVVSSCGGNEWWKGESSTVEVNKKKFLLPTNNRGG